MSEFGAFAKEMLNAVPVGAWGIVGAIVGASSTYLLGRTKYRKDKIWDSRLKAYSGMISYLERALSTASMIRDHFDEDPQRYFATVYKDHQVHMWTQLQKFRKIGRENYLLLSSRSLKAIEEFETYLRLEDFSNDDPPDTNLARMSQISMLRDAIEINARRQLRLPLR